MIPELVEKQKRLHAEMTAILQGARSDGRETLNGDEEQNWQARNLAYDAVSAQIVRYQKQAEIEAALAAPEERRAAPNPVGDARPSSGLALQHLRQSSADFEMALRGWFLRQSNKDTDDHRRAAQRTGFDIGATLITLNMSRRALQTLRPDGIRDWEQRAQTITTTGGGYTIPDETMLAIEKALLWYGPMRETSKIQRTETGADLPWPTVNDTNKVGRILDINTPVTPTDAVFGQLVFKAWKYSSDIVLVPIELMQDNAVNLPELLGDLLGERIGRIQNTHFTTGAGTTLPFGIVTQATSGNAPTGSVAGGFTYPHYVDLEHSVDISYRRQGAAFMMHDVNVAKVKKLLDTTGRPIWQPYADSGLYAGAPSTLLGYPVYTNNDMATATTNGTRAVIFGALQKYMIREVLGIEMMRLNERYADFHQVGFLAVARADGNLVNAGTNPVKYMAYTT